MSILEDISINIGTKVNSTNMKYNKKSFIAPNSIDSMSAIHCKIYTDGKAIARLSDCHGSIRWHNQITNPHEKEEMIEKLDNVINELKTFKNYIQNGN
ncbi:hypothetical protein EGI16_10790 [Chryseobacterium sp. G0240]|uniref:hypothetical protein n=1 Tax=Chryseobacterium sp. G0240 TaxID=2487066 RepID=UPI000F45EAC4|nr:hypothetical protein [Chryseobacterium sp. G0240]ROI03691.1 hypothetical protein EGI16_10790 [Chryseobacterium sp. G0240]